jgi:RNA polymerase sigma factor (sigma-70 family)
VRERECLRIHADRSLTLGARIGPVIGGRIPFLLPPREKIRETEIGIPPCRRFRGDLTVDNGGGRIVVNSYAGAVLDQLDRLFNRGTVAGLSEGTLLARYAADGDEAAFAALVARHGPMVLGVCRRVLRDERDVEDAFQATFFVLVRRAGAIRDGDLVGRWLHGVAHRVAVRARAHSARRFVHEQSTAEPVEPASDDSTSQAVERRELATIVDEEVTRLPSSLRDPVVLCYLEGLSHDEAARRLRWPVGTVRSRMARAREILRRRLARRGVTAEGAAIATSLARPPVPPEWLDATVRGSLNLATRTATAATMASARSVAIARKVLLTMAITKILYIGAAGFGIALALVGIPALAVQDEARQGRSAPERIRLDGGEEKSPKESKADPARFGQQAAPVPVQKDGSSNDPTAGSSKPARSSEPGDRSRGSARAQFVYMDQTSNGQMRKLVVVSPDGARVALYDTQSGKSVRLKLPAIKGVRREVLFRPGMFRSSDADPLPGRMVSTNHPLFSALDMDQAGKVTQIVAFNVLDGASSVADVPEPADRGSVKIFLNAAVFRVGRRLYAYSEQARRWGELEVAAGAEAEPHYVSGALMVQTNEKLYRFDYGAGKWDDIYASSIGEEPAGPTK